MKTYTLTWRNNPSFVFPEWNKSGIYRVLFRPYSRYYFAPNESPLHNFLMLVAFSNNYRSHYMRLLCSGRLVARTATYQGV